VLGLREPTGEADRHRLARVRALVRLLVVAVGAAVNEELFCRGFLATGGGRYGVLVACC